MPYFKRKKSATTKIQNSHGPTLKSLSFDFSLTTSHCHLITQLID